MAMDIYTMMKHEKLVAIFRKQPADEVLKISTLLAETGFHFFEITMESPEAVTTIRQLKARLPECKTGAGTVKTSDDARRAVDAGADFIVTPVLNEQLVAELIERGMPVIPGAFTPSEIFKAWRLGARMVKVFPASTLGAGFIKTIKGPMSEVPLMVTGGVNLQNVADFLNAGVDAVGVGSSLFPGKAVETGDWETVRNQMEKWKMQINGHHTRTRVV